MRRAIHSSSDRHRSSRDVLDTVWLRRWLRVLIPLHTSPKRIALGISIGVLIAFTPSIGFQMGLALVLASILNASRVAAMASVWITNPLTMGPIFALTYAVGRPFWFSSPDVGLTELSQTIGGGYSVFSVGAVFSGFHSIFSMGSQIVIPMLIGGLITGAVVGGLCYLPAKTITSMIHKVRRRKTRKARRGTSGGTGYASRPMAKHRAGRNTGANTSESSRRAA